MISMNVRTKPPNLAQEISNLPRNIRGPAVEEASRYLIGNEYHGLKYYPARPGSRYIRTYLLRMGWWFNSDGVRSRIRNPVSYAICVMDDQLQARVHRGIWRTVSQVEKDNERGMIQAVDRMVQRIIKERGL